MIERVLPYVSLGIFLYWAFLCITVTVYDSFFVYCVLHSAFYLVVGIILFYSKKFVIFLVFVFKCFVLTFYLNLINFKIGSNFDYFTSFQNYTLVVKSVKIDLLITLFVVLLGFSSVIVYCLFCSVFLLLQPCMPSSLTRFFERPNGQVDFKKCFTKLSDQHDDVCCICLVEFDDTTYQSNACDHIFHMNCIQKLISNDHKNCPLCKQQFSAYKIIYKV